MPVRRGLGASTGTFKAECEYQSGKCTLADNRRLAEPALIDAVADNAAVLDQVVFGKLVPHDARVLFVGNSRGGFLSLQMAAERPRNTAGVVNFVGGSISMPPAWPEDETKVRIEWHRQWLERMAQRHPIPTLWIYGVRDPFYPETVTRGLFDDYLRAGGRGRFVLVAEHTLPTGHNVAQAPELWEREVKAYLELIDSAPPNESRP